MRTTARRRGSSSERITPSSRRSSASAARPVDATEDSDSRALPGSLSNTSSPAAACTTITLTLWAITSCSSRAIRVRSSITARSAFSSRSRSRRAARASSSARYARRVRRLSPTTHAIANTASSGITRPACGPLLTVTATVIGSATHAAARIDTRRSQRAATVYSATITPSGTPDPGRKISSSVSAVTVIASTATGR